VLQNRNLELYVSHNTGFQFDYVFDWTILKYQQAQMTSAPPRAIVSTSISHPVTFLQRCIAVHMGFLYDYLLMTYLGSSGRTKLWDGSCGEQ
jgi:hypothetical protein